MIQIPIQASSDVELPAYKTDQAAGMDLTAHLGQALSLEPMERQLIPTGLRIALPAGLEGQIRPRSGLAYKKGLSVLNAPGTIDADYRGEISVLLVNFSKVPVSIEPGERIAQLVVARHERVDWEPRESLDETARGSGGFGSTGAR